jgi:hypothetical protein
MGYRFVLGHRKRAGRRIAAMLAALLGAPGALGGTWTRLAHNAPAGVNMLILLSDGTVMASNQSATATGSAWFRLTPDSHGSYVNGTWTGMPVMHSTRLYYSSQMLRDGRVFVAGGEYGTGAAKAEVFDPTTSVWTVIPVPTSLLDPTQPSPVVGETQQFADSISAILPNGKVMISPVAPKTAGQTIIFDPATNALSAGPSYHLSTTQDEASWVKLADSTILTIDPFGVNSERFNPATNSWINDSNTPVSLYDSVVGEIGAGILLPSGQAFYLGANGHTAIYTPSGTTSPGTWAAGADIPNNLSTPDAPAAMLVTGRVLCAVGPQVFLDNTGLPMYPAPTSFYEYDPASNSFSSQPAPNGATDNVSPFSTIMLALPDGNILFTHFASDVYIYHPTGTPILTGRPALVSVEQNADGSYHLKGTGFNGNSEGAAYGDDAQMSTNYPIARLADANNHVYYGRTYNWSSTGVMTGSLIVSTDCQLPDNLPTGQYSLAVVANGIPSDTACPGPAFTSSPSAQSVCVGDSASFSAAASGAPAPTYRWRRGSTTLQNGGNISGADTPTLTITGATSADASDFYTCVAADVCGVAVSQTVSLKVAGPISITTHPASQYLCHVGPASFSVVADGLPGYQWRRNGTPILGATSATYSMAAAGSNDAGTYDCILTNGCDTVTSNSAVLTVCLADYTCLGGVTVGDIFSFLTGWFSGVPQADINQNGTIEVQDIFDFLNIWFAGC